MAINYGQPAAAAAKSILLYDGSMRYDIRFTPRVVVVAVVRVGDIDYDTLALLWTRAAW